MSHLPLWFKGLSPELEKHAEKTLGETPELRQKKLDEFRQLIKAKKDLYSRDDDAFLLRFLRTKKFDVQNAFKVLKSYYALQDKYKGIFTKKTPSEVRKVGDMKAIVALPHRLPPGSHLCLFRFGSLDLQEASAVDYIAFQIVFGEMILDCEATQVCGGVNVIDFRGMTFQHYTQFLTPSFISLIITILQDCWPERIRAVHFVYEPLILHGLYMLFKPVLKAKFKERLFFHGNNIDSLHQHIPPVFLPEELGGNLGPLDNTQFLSYFLDQESSIKENKAFGLLEKK